METAKEYEINHFRFHTCCPPEAAFTAADRLGNYLEPELPLWGTITAPRQEDHDEKMQQYLISEGIRILDTFGNHPKRHLYVQGSNNFQFTSCILPEDDFFCGFRFRKDRLIRGSYATCDAPLDKAKDQPRLFPTMQLFAPLLPHHLLSREKISTVRYNM